jgi:riboflavin biosynthesis pyrimidine reductase
VIVNMVCTADGATVDPTGRTGALGGEGDRQAFHALRSVADVIVAGAETVRTENYGQAVMPPEAQAARKARGQAPRPPIAVVSASLRLDPGMRLFTTPGPRPLVLTTRASDPDARDRLADRADVVVVGEDSVDWRLALPELRRRTGAGIALVEGGPSVNGQLVAGLVDELCLTVAPMLAGGRSPRVAHGEAPAEMRHLALAHVLEDGGDLLLRYVAADLGTRG